MSGEKSIKQVDKGQSKTVFCPTSGKNEGKLDRRCLEVEVANFVLYTAASKIM